MNTNLSTTSRNLQTSYVAEDAFDHYRQQLRERDSQPSYSFGEDKLVYSNLACDVYKTPDGKYYVL